VTTKTSDRLIELLELFGSGESVWTVERGAARLGISVSNAYRYFRTLANAEYIVSNGPGRYVLGPAIMKLDRLMRLNDPLINAARVEMRSIVSAAPPYSVAILCRLYNGQIICIHEELILPPQLSVSYERGLPMPLWRGAASKAVLAHLPLKTIKALWDAHGAEIGTSGLGPGWDQLKAQVRALRGHEAITTLGELGTPTRGVAAPIFDNGQVIGSLGLVLLTDQAGFDDPGLERSVSAAAVRITANFGNTAGTSRSHAAHAES
jgi:DNA-binding IclR family transcriptional regulator